jgi:hypothetical protein
MKNKYQIGDWVEFMTDERIVKKGQIYRIKACTKRFPATKQVLSHSVLVPDAPLGYAVLNFSGQILEKQIIRKIDE